MGTKLKDFFETLHREIDCWRFEILDRIFHLSAIIDQVSSRHSLAASAFRMYLYFVMVEKEEVARGTLTIENKVSYLEVKKRWLKKVEDTVNKLRLDDRPDYLKDLILCEVRDALDKFMSHYGYHHYGDFKSKEIEPFVDRAEIGYCTPREVGILVTGSKRYLKLEVLEQ